jgi:hypothetical protein
LYPFLKKPKLAHAELGILARIAVQSTRQRERAPLIVAIFESEGGVVVAATGVDVPEDPGERGIDDEKRVIWLWVYT